MRLERAKPQMMVFPVHKVHVLLTCSLPASPAWLQIVSLGSGVNRAMESWGDVLLAQYGKVGPGSLILPGVLPLSLAACQHVSLAPSPILLAQS